MKRRDFLRAASGVAGAAAAAGTASAESNPGALSQEDNSSGNQTGNESTGSGSGGLPGAGTTKTVEVGPGGSTKFAPEQVYIQPGATVKWVWKSDGHNVVPKSQPEGASWEGVEDLHDTGFEYEHQFTVKGKYHYVCTPHESLGMVGDVIVNESGQAPGAGGGEGGGEANPEHMGVPFQAHFVGIATAVMMLVSLVFTFFTVKYGESRHASSPE